MLALLNLIYPTVDHSASTFADSENVNESDLSDFSTILSGDAEPTEFGYPDDVEFNPESTVDEADARKAYLMCGFEEDDFQSWYDEIETYGVGDLVDALLGRFDEESEDEESEPDVEE